MAASKERFSIRNYAATMRIAAVDPALCGPFAGIGHGNPPLPPIPVRRFRWWADAVIDDLITASQKSSESPSKRSAEEEYFVRSLKERPAKIRTMAELFASSAPEEEKKAARTRKRKRKGGKEGIKLNKKNVCKSKMMSSTHIHSIPEPTYKKKFRKKTGGVVVESQKFENVMKTMKKGAEFIKCRQRRSTRHVTFSGKDDILGGSKKSSRMDHPQIKNHCQISSKVLVASSDPSAVNNSSTNHEVVITDASSSKKNQVIDSHNDTGHRTLETGKKDAPLAVMIDLNQAVETNSDDENFWGSAHREISINSTEIHQESGLPNTPTTTHSERDFYWNHSPHEDSDLTSCYHITENHSGHHCSPKSLSTHTNMSIGDVFISTPLNSQGAVVQMHSEMNMASGSDHNVFSAQRDVESDIEVNHLEIMSKKVFDAGSYQMHHQSEWCSKQYRPEKIHLELNFTEITDSGSLSVQNSELIEDENGFLRSVSNRRKRNLRDRAIPDSVVQPTIRLMGENVVVDGSNRYCHACGRSRIDKNCRIGQSLFSITPEKNIPKHWIQPQRSDSPSIVYDWKLRLSRNTDESVGNYNSEDSVGIKHQCPTIESYERSIGQPMMSGSTNYKHKSAAYEPQIRYHDRESSKLSRLQTSATLPHWLLHAKCSEGKHLASSPYSDPAQTSALAPSSSQSSSIFAGTNGNSEVLMNSGIKKKGMYGSHTNSTGFRNLEEVRDFILSNNYRI